MKKLSRRQMLWGAGALGGAGLLGGFGPVSRILAGPTDNRQFVAAYFNGGWDVLIGPDARNREYAGTLDMGFSLLAPEYRDPITVTIGGTEVLWGAPMQSVVRHADVLTLFRGVNMNTVAHPTGRAYVNTFLPPAGVVPRGDSLGTRMATAVPTMDLILPNVAIGVPSFNASYAADVTGVTVSRANEVRDLLRPLGDELPAEVEALLRQAQDEAGSCVHERVAGGSPDARLRVSRARVRQLFEEGLDSEFDFASQSDVRTRYAINNPNNGREPGVVAATVYKLLKTGLSSTVTAQLQFGMDTHANTWAATQPAKIEEGMTALAALLDDLRGRRPQPRSHHGGRVLRVRAHPEDQRQQRARPLVRQLHPGVRRRAPAWRLRRDGRGDARPRRHRREHRAARPRGPRHAARAHRRHARLGGRTRPRRVPSRAPHRLDRRRVMSKTTHRATFSFALALLLASPALAQSPTECGPTDGIDQLRLLRQASLDLIGRIPTFDEVEAVRGASDRAVAVESAIAAMLESEEYYAQVRRTFQVQLWSTLDGVDLIVAGQNRLTFRGAGADRLWFQNNARRRYRGDTQVHCLNQLQTRFDAAGHPIPIQTISDVDCRDVGQGAGTCVQEGYVLVRPFWDPSIEIKVCAFDAQDMPMGLTSACDTYNAVDRGCGCGPNLERCMREADTQLIRQGIEEEPGRIFEHVVRNRQPLTDAFTTRTSFLNGPATHYYRSMSGSPAITTGGPVAFEHEISNLPSLNYQDTDTWEQVERGAAHSGVLTTMGYLMRFASNRARANRFYTAFYCDPFVPSEDGLPAEESDPHPDLRQRNGCQDCHNVLEPAAAHWGRWRGGGTFGFFEPAELSFDEPRAQCECGPGTSRANCNAFCRTYFVTASNSHPDTYALYGGLPLSTAYLLAGEETALSTGPSGLVDEPHEVSQIASCATRTLAQTLLGRELNAAELPWLEEHAAAFEGGGLDYTALVSRIISDEKYRAIR